LINAVAEVCCAPGPDGAGPGGPGAVEPAGQCRDCGSAPRRGRLPRPPRTGSWPGLGDRCRIPGTDRFGGRFRNARRHCNGVSCSSSSTPALRPAVLH